LFSIARFALGFELWRQVEHYGITILAEHQSELSNRFAKSGIDKWKDVDADTMKNGAPLLPEWLAYFECAAYARHHGGVMRYLSAACSTSAAVRKPQNHGRWCSSRENTARLNRARLCRRP
jgi:flavin reductase (DIM6/NTAB) family NADH-FMN oxidoreductase RutF